MSKEQKKGLQRIAAGLLVFACGFLVPEESTAAFGIFLFCYVLVGWDIVWEALKNLLHGRALDECFLMTLATVGAFALGAYSEGVAVMLFFRIGEWFEGYAVGKSRRSITSLMDIRPDYANVERDGALVQISPAEVQIGDTIVVKSGERVPLDGKVLQGHSLLDTSALTGESVPREVRVGAEVLSGCINKTGMLTVATTRVFADSTVEKILALVEQSQQKKAHIENFITRFARYYTPLVVAGAVLLAVLPPVFMGQPFATWFYRALTFLVISCPCALVLSVPLSFFSGIGGASRQGILVKGSNYLEALSKTEVVVFDKTGTLTQGEFAVRSIHAVGMAEREILRLAAHAEAYSNHPIAESIRKAYGDALDMESVKDAEELAGNGVCAVVDGKKILAGNSRLMQNGKITFEALQEKGTVVYVAADGQYAGAVVIRDELKKDAVLAIRSLQECGIKKTVMLTGDSDAAGRAAARALAINEVYTELLPADKVEHVERLLQEKSAKGMLAFVGDGINDAPVLMRADVGIAMGGLGSDAAIEAADVVLMTDEPAKIAVAIRIARQTMCIARENIVFAIGIKVMIMLLGALGYASLWAAVFADVGVAFLAVLNAMRAMRISTVSGSAADNPLVSGETAL
jgi:Zn2+/Cd2+-exporting ATPase